TRSFFARITGANHHHVPLTQVAEDLFSQLDSGGADRDAAALDVGFRPDVFGDIESPLKGLIQSASGMAVLQRQVVRFLELTKNFSLAKHHRIKAASHFEKMVQALRLVERINFICKRIAIIMASDQELLQRGKGPGGVGGSNGIDFDTVAG